MSHKNKAGRVTTGIIDELGIQYISGRLEEVGGIINQVVNIK